MKHLSAAALAALAVLTVSLTFSSCKKGNPIDPRDQYIDQYIGKWKGTVKSNSPEKKITVKGSGADKVYVIPKVEDNDPVEFSISKSASSGKIIITGLHPTQSPEAVLIGDGNKITLAKITGIETTDRAVEGQTKKEPITTTSTTTLTGTINGKNLKLEGPVDISYALDSDRNKSLAAGKGTLLIEALKQQ